MKTISISIDTEEDLHTKNYKGITFGLKKLTKILNKRKIKATFFITCDVLKKYPKIFQSLKKQGHEIALHGYDHIRFKDLTFEQKEEQIKKSISCFKKYLKIKPQGFRAPQHAIDNETFDLLEKYNFKYDSTYSPWNFYHILFNKIKINFKDNFTRKSIYKIRKNLYEIPVGTCIFPISALTIRALSKTKLKFFINLIKLTKNPVFMMHSWDLIEISKSKLYKRCPEKCFIEKFEMFLDSFSRDKFKKIEELVPPI